MAPTFSLIDMLGKALRPIHVVDVGAMALGGETPPYQPLSKAGVAQVVGFEAVKSECEKLNARAPKGHRFLPYFIGDGSERTFHTCNHTMTSSLYEPDTALLRRFQRLEEYTRVVSTEPVKTTRLDSVPEIERVDYLKMDVQGAELDVLKGAGSLLDATLVVQTEVEFVPMYKGQPLFAEIDQELRSHGFVLHTLLGVNGRMFRPLIDPKDPHLGMNQILWGEAVYARDFMKLRMLEPAQLLQMAVILHHAYQSYDLAALCLQYHDAAGKGDLWRYYMQRLLKAVPEAPPLD